mgnify:FL=1|jgi:uncharacterized protein
MQNGPAPTPPSSRMVEIDALRGFCLLGILLVNIELIHSPSHYAELIGISLWTQPWDQAVDRFIDIFVAGKFYPIFSFLFGFGYVWFMRRAEREGHMRFFRRTALLLFFGLLHLFLFWWGDVLTWYAFTSLFLPLFYQIKPRTLLIWAFSLPFIPLMLTALAVMFAGTNEDLAYDPQWVTQMKSLMESSLVAYGEGGFEEAFRQRLADIAFVSTNMIISAIFFVLPMFLLGMHAAKTKWLFPREESSRVVPAVGLVTLIIGIPFTLLKWWSEKRLDPELTTAYDLWNMAGTVLGDFPLSFFYICAVIYLYRRFARWKGWTVLASAGRMSLSNYLAQTIVLTTLFYGYGFALYGRIGPATALLIALVLYIAQLVVSVLWMNRFTYGPMELLWRKGTYGFAFRSAQPDESKANRGQQSNGGG